METDPDFLKPYNPAEFELRARELWDEHGYANPDVCIAEGVTAPDAPTFSMVLPPPNVTGVLHLGHVFENSIQDIAVRYNRMKGLRTLWIPGTDHAAIATQAKVEKILEKEEGKRKTDLGREAFLERVNAYAKDSHDSIVNQVKSLGSSVDWTREAYTLDEKRNLAVCTAFKRLFDDGLIYRGHRIVNWDPKGQTAISDDEIVYVEEKTQFYYLQYGPFVIGTARPETKFGDKYVVMHPEDLRYSDYTHGQTITLEWINGPIEATIIKDESIDMGFGTGVMTITPWHSLVDFEIALRHGLEKEQIIDKYGKLLPIAGEFAGKKIADARALIIEKLDSKGLVVKREDYVHNIATSERTEAVVEPQIMEQWFVDPVKPFRMQTSSILGIDAGAMTSLKELMLHVVRTGQVSILPDRFSADYFRWIENLRPWCISRQIWFGHRIPVWYRKDEVYCGVSQPDGEGWEQDPDTLDTWFSSGLWTFSTLGWPQATPDLLGYHPTTLVCPGYEILFFWVARMVLMSGYLLGAIPFETVYLHGILRDASGKKYSKSAGNNIDPIELISEFGSDALRMSMIVGVGPGSDSRFDVQKIKPYKNFANKIWNATRFVLENTNDHLPSHDDLNEQDLQKYSELDALVTEIIPEMDSYKFHLVSEKMYHYFWHTFADVHIEDAKVAIASGEEARIRSARSLIALQLTRLIRVLHPFMPHLTETIWQKLPEKFKVGYHNVLMVARFD